MGFFRKNNDSNLLNRMAISTNTTAREAATTLRNNADALLHEASNAALLEEVYAKIAALPEHKRAAAMEALGLR